MPVTSTDVRLRIFVDDIAAVIADYTHIQFFRSTGDALGPWEEITAAAATEASILGADLEPMALHGKTLEIKLNGLTTVTTSFAGADPYTAADAAADIAAALGALGTATDAGGFVRITTTATGTGASIEVTGGTGYLNLGFQLGDYGLGQDARVLLAAGTQDYELIDHNGDTDYWYRTRYLNTGTGIGSQYSTPFQEPFILRLPATDLITGTVHLVDLSGRGLLNQRINIYNLFEPSRRSGYGVFGMERDIYTDVDGYAEIPLVRGSLIQAAFEQTSVVRRIRVPTTGAEFDILDPTLMPDNFGIQEPVLQYAERRSP